MGVIALKKSSRKTKYTAYANPLHFLKIDPLKENQIRENQIFTKVSVEELYCIKKEWSQNIYPFPKRVLKFCIRLEND